MINGSKAPFCIFVQSPDMSLKVYIKVDIRHTNKYTSKQISFSNLGVECHGNKKINMNW